VGESVMNKTKKKQTTIIVIERNKPSKEAILNTARYLKSLSLKA
jgi:hypothetical protein